MLAQNGKIVYPEGMRKTKLAVGEYYHLYNRGTEKRKIFLGEGYYRRFVSILRHYLSYDYSYSMLHRRIAVSKNKSRNKILEELERYKIRSYLEIIAFCLMPNHYHLVVRQLREKGISKFMHKLGTSFTNYFNIRNERSGRLFEGPYKAKRIKSDEQLKQTVRYAHINPQSLVESEEELLNYPWSSLAEYVGIRDEQFINSEVILGEGTERDRERYRDFVLGKWKAGERKELVKVGIDDDFDWFEEVRNAQKGRRVSTLERIYKSDL